MILSKRPIVDDQLFHLLLIAHFDISPARRVQNGNYLDATLRAKGPLGRSVFDQFKDHLIYFGRIAYPRTFPCGTAWKVTNINYK